MKYKHSLLVALLVVTLGLILVKAVINLLNLSPRDPTGPELMAPSQPDSVELVLKARQHLATFGLGLDVRDFDLGFLSWDMGHIDAAHSLYRKAGWPPDLVDSIINAVLRTEQKKAEALAVEATTATLDQGIIGYGAARAMCKSLNDQRCLDRLKKLQQKLVELDRQRLLVTKAAI
jgi:hypothetical protein